MVESLIEDDQLPEGADKAAEIAQAPAASGGEKEEPARDSSAPTQTEGGLGTVGWLAVGLLALIVAIALFHQVRRSRTRGA